MAIAQSSTARSRLPIPTLRRIALSGGLDIANGTSASYAMVVKMLPATVGDLLGGGDACRGTRAGSVG